MFICQFTGAIKKFSAWPSSVQNKIKILFDSYSSKAQTRHAQCDFRAINILCILVYEHSVHQWWVKNFSNDTDVTQQKIISQVVIQDEPTTSILNQNNKACNGMIKSVKIVISLHCIIPFFPCGMQTTDNC